MPHGHAPPSTPHEALVNALPAALVAVDADGAVTAWNPAAEAWFAVPAARALGSPAAEAGIPGAELWMPLVRAAREQGKAGKTEAFRAGERWLKLVVSPLGSGGALLLGKDVTAEVLAKVEAESLREVAVATASTLDADEIVAVVCARARELMGADYARVDLPLLDGRVGACGDEAAWDALRAAHPGVLRRVRDTGEPLLLGAA
ncbi:MAG: fold, partial [Gemmatimonadetes bacterium]|nr:fold [Gemmatimonadota bacterium]